VSIPVRLNGLELGSMPIANERWRVVVANVTRFKVTKELLTLGWATTDTESLAQAWYSNAASAQLGFPSAQPVAQGELFVVDMKFSGLSAALLPLSAILNRWEQTTPNTQVVAVSRVPATENSTQGQAARSSALNVAAAELEKAQRANPSPAEKLASAGRTAITTIQVGFWAVIVGGLAYLVAKSGLGRK